jgi:acetylornithine/succinyldiaminopimelate/putrescine aminotransferase
VSGVFFCNSGAEANENALKLAIKQTGRNKIVSFDGGWHGRTLLALSATDDPKITQPYADLLVPHVRVPFIERAPMEAIDWNEIAAVIVEPIQSMSGVRVAARDWYQRLRELTAAAGTWLIFDEIQTGLGRTGAPTAAEFFGIKPDAITFAKGLASGVPIGATTLAPERVAAVQPGDLGSTFGGGPLAMAALLATLGVVNDEGLVVHAALAGARLKRSLVGDAVSEVTGAGLLLGLRTRGPASALKAWLYDRRILVGGSGDPQVLRLMPCLNVSDAALDALEAAVHAFPTSC